MQVSSNIGHDIRAWQYTGDMHTQLPEPKWVKELLNNGGLRYKEGKFMELQLDVLLEQYLTVKPYDYIVVSDTSRMVFDPVSFWHHFTPLENQTAG
jgi:hypothetical protein